MKYILGEIAKAIKGKLRGDSEALALGVTTDSREVQSGDIFFAIRGERFNGEDFVLNAISKGAVAAVVSESFTGDIKGNLIKVDDTVQALGRLASFHRSNLNNTKVIAVTGSTGKTTTKEMLYFALKGSFRVVRNRKSYNNFIGVPLTILSAEQDTEILISEIGTNHPGEIEYLSKIVRPHIGVLTSIGPSHLAFFGNVRNVATEKSHLFDFLEGERIAVINMDIPYFNEISSHLENMITVSTMSKEADFYAEIKYMDFNENRVVLNDRYELTLHPGGMGTVYGALFSLAIASILGVPEDEVLEGLEEFKGVSMRKEVQKVGRYRILNDAYNANPDSMKDFLTTLKPFRDSVLLILGDMLELGEYEEHYHREIGKLVQELGFKKLITVGRASAAIGEQVNEIELNLHFETPEEVALAISRIEGEEIFIALKASRAIQLEKIIEKLRSE